MIDNAGRLVIPKQMRERLGLRSGRRVVLTEEHERLVISPEPGEAELKEKSGVLVLAAPLHGEVPDHRRLREERLDRHTPR